MSDAPSIDAWIGAQIKARRQARGKTQSELGHAIGISFQQVQKYENGSNRIAASDIIAVSAALGTTPEAFFPSGQETSAGSSTALLLKADALQLMGAFTRIRSPKTRRMIVRLVQAMIEEEQ
mgnify:FL=1